jgi:hypothetical protein
MGRLSCRRLAVLDTLYRRPDFAWVSSDFSCCFLMMCDQTFYDPESGRYTVQVFLEHGQQEFGKTIPWCMSTWTMRERTLIGLASD